MRGGYAAVGVSDHNNRPVNGRGSLRDCFSVGIHVPEDGRVFTAACQRHGVHVDIRQLVEERTVVVGLVPGTRNDEQRRKLYASNVFRHLPSPSMTRMIGLP